MRMFLSKLRKIKIEQLARHSLATYQIDSPPVNPKPIVKKLGQLFIISGPEEIGFTTYDSNQFKIYVNTIEYAFMAKWTYAHECGHILLNHFGNYRNYLTNHQVLKYLDLEANAFAAELLMPTDWIINYVKKYPPNIASNLGTLIRIFDVSWESLINRLHSLGIQDKSSTRHILSSKQQNSYQLDISSDFNLAVCESAATKENTCD